VAFEKDDTKLKKAIAETNAAIRAVADGLRTEALERVDASDRLIQGVDRKPGYRSPMDPTAEPDEDGAVS
jgi:hypothetical protein